jgi:hypothetical protein
MKTPPTSVALFAIAAILGAVGQYLYKTGASRITNSFLSYFNLPLLN